VFARVALILAPWSALAQDSISSDEPLAALGELVDSGRITEAERLVKQMLPNPALEPAQSGFLRISLYDFAWALVGYSYLRANDYANAERLGKERLQVEASVDEKSEHLPTFLMLMADVYRLQSKHAAAAPLYQRMYRLWIDQKLPAEFQNKTFLALAECYIALGRQDDAVQILKPAKNRDGSDAGIAFQEERYNAYAVALEWAGRKAEAVQLEAVIDAKSRRQPASNQQDRELFRARLLSAEGSYAKADAIYQKWIKYWESRSAPPSIDAKESLEIRTQALAEYTHFLSHRGRFGEAKAARARWKAMGCGLGKGQCGYR
jgi:tetratricopeptide (TPR) repeat protein